MGIIFYYFAKSKFVGKMLSFRDFDTNDSGMIKRPFGCSHRFTREELFGAESVFRCNLSVSH